MKSGQHARTSYLRAQRYISTFGLSVYSAEVITSSRELADYFEETVAHHDDARAVSNWIMGELLGYLNATGRELSECKVTPEEMAALLGMIKSGKVSQSIGKDVFTEMCGTGSKAADIVAAKGLAQISDESELETLADRVIDANPAQVEQYRAGRQQVLGFFVGQIMKETKGRANPQVVNEILKKKLAG